MSTAVSENAVGSPGSAPGDETRRRAIEAAAYEVLSENGYRRTSMLAVAKRARASNQTLYRWYGSKEGLFRALIERNAEEAAAMLRRCRNTDPDETMLEFGSALLRMLTGQRAVALNRAAAADASETGELGRALARSGRGTVLPLLETRFEVAREQGRLAFDDLEETVERYVALLVGDLQLRCVTGALEPPDEDTIRKRAATAWARVRDGSGR